MPLLSLWKSDPETVDKFTIQQIVSFAGDGRLTDESECSSELRSYLSGIKTEKIAKYIDFCLSEQFDKGGSILQDLVNELGRRLDYVAENGLYSGRKNAIGNDGLWLSPENHAIVIEVKTTDAYRIPLDVIATYRLKLISAEKIDEKSSILIVVGRQDTGELEAQVRGSRHAWDIRLISVEALIKLVNIKENSMEAETGRKIRSVLVPVEYTRVDSLVDVVFAAASDAQEVESVIKPENSVKNKSIETQSMVVSNSNDIQSVRESIVSAFEYKMKSSLIRKSRAMYWSADHSTRLVCAVSKRYDSGEAYWYAFHPAWRAFLEEGNLGVFVLGCLDLNRSFALPIEVLVDVLPSLNVTERQDSMYWHVKLDFNNLGEVCLNVPKASPINLESYSLLLQKDAS